MDVSVEEIKNETANLFPPSRSKQVRFTTKTTNGMVPIEDSQLQNYKTVVLPRQFEKYFNQINSLPVYEDDVWVISYPKCGTTWTQEAVWQICNDCNLEANGKELTERFPFLEYSGVAAEVITPSSVEKVRNMSRPRYIKSHLPTNFLPSEMWSVKPKIIYVMRDPKDAAVSYYHHYQMFYQYSGTREDFLDSFLQFEVEYGNYWDHVKQFNFLKNEPYVYTVRFEDLKHRMRNTLIGLAKFLGKSIDATKLCALEEHLDFNQMKNNRLLNREDRMKKIFEETGMKAKFMRKGETNSYKDEMHEEYVEKFNAISSIEFKSENLY